MDNATPPRSAPQEESPSDHSYDNSLGVPIDMIDPFLLALDAKNLQEKILRLAVPFFMYYGFLMYYRPGRLPFPLTRSAQR
jgi:hypothetical protein